MNAVSGLIGTGISFLSLEYLGFLLIAALVRYLCPKGARTAVLLVFSWLFYAAWNPACLVFLLFTTVTTFLAGRYVGGKGTAGRVKRSDGRETSGSVETTGKTCQHERMSLDENAGRIGQSGTGSTVGKTSVLVLCIAANLGILFFCKYWGMFFPGIFEQRLLPVGISFYTLQALGYVIDCYREGRGACTDKSAGMQKKSVAESAGARSAAGTGVCAGEKSEKGEMCGENRGPGFLQYALFVSFFPGILSGPIERGKNMLPQYENPCGFSWDNLRNGVLIMTWGYFLKMVLADRIAIVVNTIYADPESWKGTLVVLAVLLYSIQIYCDFAGYSAIAIGSARVLGFRVMQNFTAPYLTSSVAEFWRHWHISLSTWFRDYLYIPLGGNRKGMLRKYVNILIVFAVSGLWHGAGFTFLFWGFLHGIYQVAGYLLKPVRNALVRFFKIDRRSFSHRVLQTGATFLLVSFAWIFFRAESFGQAAQIIRCMKGVTLWQLGDGSLLKLGLDTMNWVLLAAGLIFLFVRDRCVRRGISLRVQIERQGIWLRWILYIGAVLLILVCGIWGPGYDASTFIYSQF